LRFRFRFPQPPPLSRIFLPSYSSPGVLQNVLGHTRFWFPPLLRFSKQKTFFLSSPMFAPPPTFSSLRLFVSPVLVFFFVPPSVGGGLPVLLARPPRSPGNHCFVPFDLSSQIFFFFFSQFVSPKGGRSSVPFFLRRIDPVQVPFENPPPSVPVGQVSFRWSAIHPNRLSPGSQRVFSSTARFPPTNKVHFHCLLFPRPPRLQRQFYPRPYYPEGAAAFLVFPCFNIVPFPQWRCLS